MRLIRGSLILGVIALASATFLSPEIAYAQKTYTWRPQTRSADWSTALNWEPQGVPGEHDTAIVDPESGPAFSVACPAALTLRNLTIRRSILTGAGQMTVTGRVDASDVRLIGSGSLAIAGEMSVRRGGSEAGLSLAGGWALINRGRVALVDATLHIGSNSHLVNQADGAIDLQGHAQILGEGVRSIVTNEGLVQKTGTGTSFVGGHLAITNGGRVEVQSGALVFRGPTLAVTSSGSFDAVAAGASMAFNDGHLVLRAGSRFSGPGTILVIGATVAFDADVRATRLQLGDEVAGPRLLGRNHRLEIEEVLEWRGGTIDGAIVLIGSDTDRAALLISGDRPKRLEGGGRIDNFGSARWTGRGSIVFSDATFRNMGVFEAANDADVVAGGGVNGFLNLGRFIKTAKGELPAGRTAFDVVFNNDFGGNVHVMEGTLALTSGTSSGRFEVAASANITFVAGRHLLNDARFAGEGFVRVRGGVLDVAGTVTVGNFELGPSSTLDGSGDLEIADRFEWTGGTIAGSGRVVGGPDCVTSISNDGFSGRTPEARTVEVLEATNWFEDGEIALTDEGVPRNGRMADPQTDPARPLEPAAAGGLPEVVSAELVDAEQILSMLLTNSAAVEALAPALAVETEPSRPDTSMGDGRDAQGSIDRQSGRLPFLGPIAFSAGLPGAGQSKQKDATPEPPGASRNGRESVTNRANVVTDGPLRPREDAPGERRTENGERRKSTPREDALHDALAAPGRDERVATRAPGPFASDRAAAGDSGRSSGAEPRSSESDPSPPAPAVEVPGVPRCVDVDGNGLTDNDGDGLCDNWELAGIDINEDGIVDLPLNAPPFNASPNHKDLFVEIDAMQADTHHHRPRASALQQVIDAFARAPVANPDGVPGITLHLMVDETVPDIDAIAFSFAGPGAMDDFDDLKLGNPTAPCGTGLGDGHFGTVTERSSPNCANMIKARRAVFRYAIFGHQLAENLEASGIAELLGDDFMVTLGGWSAEALREAGGRSAVEAAVFMRQLGHTLGLQAVIDCDPDGNDDVTDLMSAIAGFDTWANIVFTLPASPHDVDRGVRITPACAPY